MTATAITIADSMTMLRRNLLHMIRYPGLTGFVIGIPVVLLLLFVYVFGGTLGAGLPGGGPGGATQDYLAYVVPGILLIGVAGVASGASIGIAQDMTEGIVARFRSMAISRAAVLTGHVLGNTIQGLLCLTFVLGIALLMGLRPSAGPLAWLALTGFLALVCFSVSWVAIAMGMSAKSVETASNTPMIFTLLPFLGSGFVPTDSMSPSEFSKAFATPLIQAGEIRPRRIEPRQIGFRRELLAGGDVVIPRRARDFCTDSRSAGSPA